MKITTEKENRIVHACKNGMTGKAAAATFGVSPSSVASILRRNGVKTRIGRPPTCEIDHGAFDAITPESAYWTGFLFADGCIADYKDGAPQLIIDINTGDRKHVEKFRLFLKSSHAIIDVVHKTNLPRQTNSRPRTSVAFRVRSTRLVERLRSLGMRTKSTERAPCPEIENSFDFWRGAIDGDGTVAVYDDGYPVLILCGHMPLILAFQTFLLRQGVASSVHNTLSGIFQIRLNATPAKTIISLLYKNAAVALDRKLETAQKILK